VVQSVVDTAGEASSRAEQTTAPGAQGRARDVKARDRDETETLTSRDRDIGFTSRDETEIRR